MRDFLYVCVSLLAVAAAVLPFLTLFSPVSKIPSAEPYMKAAGHEFNWKTSFPSNAASSATMRHLPAMVIGTSVLVFGDLETLWLLLLAVLVTYINLSGAVKISGAILTMRLRKYHLERSDSVGGKK